MPESLLEVLARDLRLRVLLHRVRVALVELLRRDEVADLRFWGLRVNVRLAFRN